MLPFCQSKNAARQFLARHSFFGNISLVPETTTTMRNWVGLESLLQNLRCGLRQLRRSPGFSITVMLIIGVGISVTTAMYSILYAVVLQPLPFVKPKQLVSLTASSVAALSLPTVQDWERGSHAFQSIAAYGGWAPRIESSAGVGRANAILVSQNFIRTLGATLEIGQDFSQTGNETDCLGQAIVTDRYWRRMGGGQALVNRSIQIDYRTYAVIGVLAPSAAFEEMSALGAPSILVPIGCDPAKSPRSRGDSSFVGIGRLYPGVPIRQATAELTTKQQNLTRNYPEDYPPSFTVILTPLADYISGANTRSALFSAFAACGLLLLIATPPQRAVQGR